MKTHCPPDFHDEFNPDEIKKFDALSYQWWDKHGPLKTLHDINPARLQCMTQYVDLQHQRLLDVGCGGGILSESCAQQGVQVTGIDISPKAIQVAQQHAALNKVNIDYHRSTLSAWLSASPPPYDVITCMEMLEHVPHPDRIIMHCARAVRAGGWVFFSTLNRSLRSYLLAILGAEYVLNLIPKGTHRYEQCIRPAELDRCARQNGLSLQALHGLNYQPFSGKATLSHDVSINYIAVYLKQSIA